MDSTETDDSGTGGVGTASFWSDPVVPDRPREPVVVPLAGMAGSGEAKLAVNLAAFCSRLVSACATGSCPARSANS